MSISQERRTRRPAEQPKKGRSSWKPASVTDVVNKEPGYRYRWANKGSDNIITKETEGWEKVSSLTADQATPTDTGRIDDGQSLSSVYEKKDVVLMRIPEETAQERDAYFQEKSDRQISSLTAHVKKEINKGGAPAHGNITISSRLGDQVIE